MKIKLTSFKLDLYTILLASGLIAGFAQELLLMTFCIPLLMLARTIVWMKLPQNEREHSIRTEWIFLLICTLLGGFNDWNSVVNKQIYDYTVPHFFPQFSTIPIWMLLFWGMILRFMYSLFRLPALIDVNNDRPDNACRLVPSGQLASWQKVVALLLFVLVTRQGIYRWYMDPLWSWLPFAGALLVYPMLFPFRRAEFKLAGLALLFGPVVEVLYIQVGHLHRYHHGIVGGVPIWIILWWILIIPIWRNLSRRVVLRLDSF